MATGSLGGIVGGAFVGGTFVGGTFVGGTCMAGESTISQRKVLKSDVLSTRVRISRKRDKWWFNVGSVGCLPAAIRISLAIVLLSYMTLSAASASFNGWTRSPRSRRALLLGSRGVNEYPDKSRGGLGLGLGLGADVGTGAGAGAGAGGSMSI